MSDDNTVLEKRITVDVRNEWLDALENTVFSIPFDPNSVGEIERVYMLKLLWQRLVEAYDS